MFSDACCVEYDEREVRKKKYDRDLTNDEHVKKVQGRRLATCFLRRANPAIYGPLLRELRDSYLYKIDIYPETLDETYSLLQHHSSGKKKLHRNDQCSDKEIVKGLQHAQKTSDVSREPVPGTDGRCIQRTRC